MHIAEHNHNFSPRVSFGRRGSFACGVPLFIIDSFIRKSFSYDKLHQEPLKLTILKMDGSAFKIEVVKTATVGDLKKEVENAFNYLPKEGPGKVSWSHVWGHFCLCYDGQKLLVDNDYIGYYGIRDGDQLLFIRHVSINYNLKRSWSVDHTADLEQPMISDAYEEGEEINGVHESYDDKESSTYLQDDDGSIKHREYNLGTIFGKWFSYRRLYSRSEADFEQRDILSSSKSFHGFLGMFRYVVRGYSNNHNPRTGTWKAD